MHLGETLMEIKDLNYPYYENTRQIDIIPIP